MLTEYETFQAQFNQHGDPDVHYENIAQEQQLERYRTYMRNVHLLLNMNPLSNDHAYKTIIKISIHSGFSFKMMQEKIQYHRVELRRLEAEMAMPQRHAPDYAYIERLNMERLKHHQKTHQWLVYEIQKERMFQAHYSLAPRRQNT